MSLILPELQNLNLNGNAIDNNFEKTIAALKTIPNLQSLYINLHEEEQVDMVMNHLTELLFLNGLPVEREQDGEEGEEE